jgi:hypothetical protein
MSYNTLLKQGLSIWTYQNYIIPTVQSTHHHIGPGIKKKKKKKGISIEPNKAIWSSLKSHEDWTVNGLIQREQIVQHHTRNIMFGIMMR